MNKRQWKKHKKKMKMFTASFASSYRELRELDRSYHEFVLMCDRMRKCGHIFDLKIEF